MGSCNSRSEEDNKIITVYSAPNLNTMKNYSSPLASPRLFKPGSVTENLIRDIPAATIKTRPKSKKDISMINSFFSNHFLFCTLTEEQKHLIIEKFVLYTLPQGQIVFRQNQPGSSFFLVSSGSLDVLLNDNKINTIKEGQGFGEIALIQDTLRTATVRTASAVTLWGIDKLTFQSIFKEMNEKHLEENMKFIQLIQVFSSFTKDQLQRFVEHLAAVYFNPGQTILKAKETREVFYIIKKGIVSCVKRGEEEQRLHPGQYFGEQLIVYKSPQSASYVALGNVECLSITKQSLSLTLGENFQKIMFKNTLLTMIANDKLLSKLNEKQVKEMINQFRYQSVISGSVVVQKNLKICSNILMVLKGRLKTGSMVFHSLSVIGIKEIASKSENVFLRELVAEEDTELAVIHKESFEKCIGGRFENIIENNETIRMLKRVPILIGLSEDVVQALKDQMKAVKYSQGQTIVEQGSAGNSFFIVKSGRLQIIIDGVSKRTIGKYDYFGERSIIFGQKRTASVLAGEEAECWVLFQDDFNRIVDQEFRNQLLKRIVMQDDNFSLDDLLVIKKIGKGMHSNIYLSADKKKKVLYAVKTVTKKRIAAFGLYENLDLEKKILLQLDHFFIMKLVKVLKDEKRVYFVCEYVKGLDLFEVTRKLGFFSEDNARFYMACLVIILQFLHEQDIVYRDLNPKNIRVDEEGYLKLVDLGSAKILKGRTYTIAGCPHYLAPEVILRKGYGIQVDYWSLGVILYDLLYEQLPFGNDERDPLIVYEKILNDKLEFPKQEKISFDGRKVIEMLLNKDPNQRLTGGLGMLRVNPWLAKVDWDKILKKEERAPYHPEPMDLDLKRVVKNFGNRSWESAMSKEEAEEVNLPVVPLNLKWCMEF